MMMSPRAASLLSLVLSLGLLAGCAEADLLRDGRSTPDREADRAELLRLNDELARSQIVARDSTFFSEVAVDEFRVLTPGGLFENKEQVIRGLSAWDATAVELSGTEVVFYGPVALVMGRMDIDGEMRPVGRWGPLKYMSTWVREGDEWRLVSRSLTPCFDVLVQMGHC
jgi:hypothetical protein